VFRAWRVILAMRLATLVCGLLMCFLTEDYSRFHISYAQMLFLDKLLGPVLLVGALLTIIGSIGILGRLSNKTAILLGVGSTLVSVVTPIGLQSLFHCIHRSRLHRCSHWRDFHAGRFVSGRFLLSSKEILATR
jgi:hypothetical protein